MNDKDGKGCAGFTSIIGKDEVQRLIDERLAHLIELEEYEKAHPKSSPADSVVKTQQRNNWLFRLLRWCHGDKSTR